MTSLIKSNSTGKVPLTSAATGPVGIVIGLSSRKLQPFTYPRNSKQKKITGVLSNGDFKT
jgi:hypothetical protein